MKTLETKLIRRLKNRPDREKIEALINEKKTKLRQNNDKRLQKKINFHLDKHASAHSTTPMKSSNNRQAKRAAAKQKWKSYNKRLKQRKSKEKTDWIRGKVEEIKSSKVVNLSSMEIPDTTYFYLARGLNFVESRKANKEDLKFDAKEFIRKLEWKTFFHQRSPVDDNTSNDNLHADMRIPSRSHPSDLKT